MLNTDQVNAIWLLLDRAGAIFTEKHGAAPIKQSDALKEILEIVAELAAGAWTREQILEAWMHQALTFIHATTGRFATRPAPFDRESIQALWNAIVAAEVAFTEEQGDKPATLFAFVEGVIERATKSAPAFASEQIARAWILMLIKQRVEAARVRPAEQPAEDPTTKPGVVLS